MASRAIVPQQQQQPRGVAKQKNGPAEGRNRRVLQDIGNLVKVPAVEGKPLTQISRPITRSFCAQLLANGQGIAEKNKKPVTEVDGGVAVNGAAAAGKGGAVTKAAVQKKVTLKPKPEIVSVVSNDDEDKSKPVVSTDEEDKCKPVSGRRSREGSSRKEVKTLTSILAARSKAACGLTTNKPKDPIVNIDAGDIDNELAVVEYVDDIYKFYKLTEDESRVHDYMDSQPDINAKMRSILVDWLIEVHNKFELMPETLYLTINIVDRYLSMKIVPRRELQLVGISSMLLACKYEEIWAPEVNDFVCISDNAYAREKVLVMEKAILGKLEWFLTVPTPYVFLVRYIKASIPSDKEMESMVFFLAELGLMHYSTITMYCPSMVAASAVYAARCTLDKSPFWSETLKHHTGYSEDQLMDCAKLLVSFHVAAAESKLKAVYRKFSKPERGAVALLTAAKSLSFKSLHSSGV
ncbi:hypothetical protein L1049_018484 [Liquidambar formosana]|uniref:B-like cyclin n=1 Tax=Liquidambar formosana TaxID=63359 RepID=A0AAP0RA57_LIQFO